MHAQVGDEIVVDAPQVGGSPRRGRILEVLGAEGHEHYRVEWDDGHESTFFPSTDAHVVHRGRPQREGQR